MRTLPPALLPILRSRVQGEILASTYLEPGKRFSLTELAARVGASVQAVSREVSRLVDAGLLEDTRAGTSRLVAAATENVLTHSLTELLALTYGPLPVVTDALRGLDGVEHAFIYGSWAARYRGEVGPPPGDVDVLVVGSVDPDVLEDRARSAEAVLHREVNVRRLRPETWDRVSDPFVQELKSRPLIELQVEKGPGQR